MTWGPKDIAEADAAVGAAADGAETNWRHKVTGVT